MAGRKKQVKNSNIQSDNFVKKPKKKFKINVRVKNIKKAEKIISPVEEIVKEDKIPENIETTFEPEHPRLIKRKKEIKKAQSLPKYIIKEKDKTPILWTGTIIFMIVISIFWIINLKGEFQSKTKAVADKNQLNWSEMKDEFSKTMEQIKKNLSEIKMPTETKTVTTTISQDLTDSKIQELKIKILEQTLLNKLATTTASSTNKIITLPTNK